jgi:hypothetical protein
MAHRVIRKVGKYQYAAIEESYRNAKPRKRIVEWLGGVDGRGRKSADEKYRAVLRENVYLYGKSRPVERYAREAAAREEYLRTLNGAGAGPGNARCV